MNPSDAPTRLRESSEWAGALGALANEPVDADRLVRGRTALRRRLAAPTVASMMMTATASAWARWGVTLGKLLGISVITVVGVGSYRRLTADPQPPVAQAPAEHASAVPQASPSAPHPLPARSVAADPPAAPAAAASLSARVAARSDLPAQLALFESARRAAAAGKPEVALERLTELETRFPNTPLGAEIELARTDYLTRAGRLAEATRSTERLSQSATHSGRRGQIYHLLGDLRLRQGDCPGAKAAYEAALAAGVSPTETTQIRRAMRRCASP